MKINFFLIFFALPIVLYAQSPFTDIDKLASENKSLGDKVEYLRQDNIDKLKIVNSLIEDKQYTKKLIESFAQLYVNGEKLKSGSQSVDTLKMKLENEIIKNKNNEKKIEELSSKIEENKTQYEAERKNLETSTTNIESNLEKVGKQEIAKKAQIEAIVNDENQNLEDHTLFLIYPQAGALFNFNTNRIGFSGELIFGIVPKGFSRIYLGGGFGYDHYAAFDAYSFRLTTGISIVGQGYEAFNSDSGASTILILEVGYSGAHERIEIIDNFDGGGIMFDIGVMEIFHVTETFHPSISLSYRYQKVQEYSELQNIFEPKSYNSLCLKVGIPLNFNK